METLFRQVYQITNQFLKMQVDNKDYETPRELYVPCRRHIYNMSTCIVQQPTAQSTRRRGPDDYTPVNLNHVWDDLECEGCYWDLRLTNFAECRLCRQVKKKECMSRYVVCNECNECNKKEN